MNECAYRHLPILRSGRFCDLAGTVIWGANCQVWAFAVVCDGVRMGDHCVIGSHSMILPHAVLGDDVHLQSHVMICEYARIGNRVFFGPGVVMGADKHPRVNHPDHTKCAPVIEDDVNVGMGAVILPGVTIHAGAIIGAGAVVTRDVPAGVTVIGNPAKRLYVPLAIQHADDVEPWRELA